MAPDESTNNADEIEEALETETTDETIVAEGLNKVGGDDDLETQMATQMAAEGLEESVGEEDLEAQMAAAMESDVGGDESDGGEDDDLEAQMATAMGGDESAMMAALSDDEPASMAQVQDVSFPQLSPSDEMGDRSSIDRLMDVDLNLSVELGRKDMQIKEILNLGPGKIIELDKLAGEPVDLLVNGKLLAKGEVVVVDENFGVRITELVDPVDRIKML